MVAPLKGGELQPHDIPAVGDVVQRLCKLVESVNSQVFNFAHASDCFCGRGGFWPLQRATDWRHDREAIAFIERATDAAISASKLPPTGVIEWSDPPISAAHGDPVDVSPILADLVRHPGCWALVHRGGQTGTLKRAALLRNAGCTTRTTRGEDGKRCLYAMWTAGIR